MHCARSIAIVTILTTMTGCSNPYPGVDTQTLKINRQISQVAIVNAHKSRTGFCGQMPEDYKTLDGFIRTRSRDNGNLEMNSDSVLNYGCEFEPQ